MILNIKLLEKLPSLLPLTGKSKDDNHHQNILKIHLFPLNYNDTSMGVSQSPSNLKMKGTLSMIIEESKIAITGKNLIIFSLKQLNYVFTKIYIDISSNVNRKII